MKLGYAPHNSYGIDDTAGRVIIVRASRRGKTIRTRVVYDDSKSPEELSTDSAIAAIEHDILNHDAITSVAISSYSSFSRWLETPFSSRSKALKVLPSLLDVQLPFPLEQCQYRFAKLGSGPNGMVRALALASRRNDLTARLATISTLGIDPVVVDHEGLALWYSAASSSRFTPQAIMYLSPDRATLVIGDGKEFGSAHGFRMGTNTILGDAASFRQWITRIQHVLRSRLCVNQQAIPWLWVGPGSEDREVRQRIENALSDQIQFSTVEDPTTYLATSLALRGLRQEAMDANLRGSELEHRILAQRRQRDFTRSSVAGILVGALLLICSIGGRSIFDARNRSAQKQVTAIASELTGLSAHAIPRGHELFVVNQQLSKAEDPGDPFLRAFVIGPSAALGRTVQAAHPLHIRITSFSARDQQFTVRGYATRWQACLKYAQTLNEQGNQVNLQRVSESSQDRIEFVLKGELGDV